MYTTTFIRTVWTHNALRYTNAPPLLAHIIYTVVLVKEVLMPSLATHKTVYINQPNREEGDFLHVINNLHYRVILVAVILEFRQAA